MNSELEQAYDLFEYASKCGFRWKYNKENKTTSIISLNYRMKRILDSLVVLLVNKKKKEWSELDAY